MILIENMVAYLNSRKDVFETCIFILRLKHSHHFSYSVCYLQLDILPFLWGGGGALLIKFRFLKTKLRTELNSDSDY
jgi:hypothetical protein